MIRMEAVLEAVGRGGEALGVAGAPGRYSVGTQRRGYQYVSLILGGSIAAAGHP